MSEQNLLAKPHNVVMENRHRLMLTGVKEVESFTETEILLFTGLGELKIRGKNLQIGKFNSDTGDFDASGEIFALVYGETAAKVPRNFITKLFK